MPKADFKITIQGDKRLTKKLGALEPKVQRKVVRQALRAAAKPIAAKTKALAPVGKTGRTRAGVKVRAMKRSRKRAFGILVQIGPGAYRGETFYAAFPEYGTKRQRGQHYMKQALDQEGPGARDTALAAIRNGIEREATKG